MCGICGIVPRRPGEVEPDRVRRMADSLTHRGPDEDGFALLRGASLGFRRLSVIDPEGSHQPLQTEDGAVHLVCNGEIYNYRELRGQLQERGHIFGTSGDAEVIAHAYEQWGMDFLTRLRGMFALALWDSRLGRAVLARDRLGIKPLAYALTDAGLVFASEIKGVLASGLVSRDIDEAALDLYLSLQYIPAPLTAYRAVRKLPAGSVMTYEGAVARVERYWRPPLEAAPAAPAGEMAERLHELLRESVRLHLQSDVPVGFFLSGGVDSSTVVALAAEVGGGPVETFSVGFEAKTHNELPLAAVVARAFGCRHHELVARADAADVLPDIVAQFDEPFGDSSAVPTYYICKAAAGSVKVVLSGDGGDELFGGYEWTRRQRFVEQWRRLPAGVRAAIAAATPGDAGSLGRRGQLHRFFGDARVGPLEGYARRVSCFSPEMKDRIYGERLRPLADARAAVDMLAGCFVDSPFDAVAAMNRADLDFYLPDDDLCKVDRMTMRHSLEGRVPLLDHNVAEFALSLPTALKIRGLTSKYILKKAMRGVLPARILAQRKQGFAIPVQQWMRGDLYGHARRILLSDSAGRRGLFRGDSVRRLLEQHRGGSADFGHQLWSLLVLEIWFRLCVDSPSGACAPCGIRLADLF